jgi:hypothetical protein
MTIETKSKALVALYKKEERLQKQLNNLRQDISDSKEELLIIFDNLGLYSSFSR